MLGTKFCCTMNSERGNRKDANTSVQQVYGAIVIAVEKKKAGARMCVVCRGNRNTKKNGKKGNFCTCDRFSADGFRTRATRVIRWRVLGVRATKVETERGGTGRPGESRTHWTTVCGCTCALCVQRAGTRGPFHAPPQLKPRYEVKSGKKRREGLRTGHKGTV